MNPNASPITVKVFGFIVSGPSGETHIPCLLAVNVSFFLCPSCLRLWRTDTRWTIEFESRKKNNSHKNLRFCDYYGPSGETRTHGLLNPIQARYHLRYTRMLDYCTTKK